MHWISGRFLTHFLTFVKPLNLEFPQILIKLHLLNCMTIVFADRLYMLVAALVAQKSLKI